MKSHEAKRQSFFTSRARQSRLSLDGRTAPKLAIGTAYSTSSRVWYTLDAGCVTQVYYPTIDTPQIRDLQTLFTHGETFFHDERRGAGCHDAKEIYREFS